MARILNAYLDPARLPDRAGLQTAIRALRFKLDLDEGFALPDPPGYLPCTLEGEDAGMYCALEATTPAPAAAGLPGHTLRLALRWGGDLREELAAALLAAALVAQCDAHAFEAEATTALPAEALMQRARTLFDQAF